jgi:ATP-dependent DNA helicase RecG
MSFEKKMFNKLISILPYKLTEEQLIVLKEIERDISSGNRMTRLLQGDVGSGKTIVSLLTSLLVIESGYQVALLAPTEILARQHYENFKNLLSVIEKEVCIQIFTSNEKGTKRRSIVQGLFEGRINIIVGTHAIISEFIEFYNLGLVIVDEQHRFGVNQRLSLISKGKHIPHVLSMTATPIPRTLILSLYGDIEVSSITKKPIGRKDIITKAVSMNALNKIVESMKKIISKGHKIYWVCPLIEESEKLDYTCVIERFEFLKQYFKEQVLMMHGKMKSQDRSEIFEKFRNGISKILVSTTIIEVGVDVHDATVIIIENAEKFGLSQLHQLRGRVGRSHLQSYCILLYENKITSLQRERIKIIRDSTDGFYIAEKDLLIRGAGEVLGTRQSGFKKYKTFDIDDPEYKQIIFEIMQEAHIAVRSFEDSSQLHLLNIFLPKNFEKIKLSF